MWLSFWLQNNEPDPYPCGGSLNLQFICILWTRTKLMIVFFDAFCQYTAVVQGDRKALRVIQHPYNPGKTCVCILNRTLGSFKLWVGLLKYCFLSMILVVVFIDSILRCIQGEEGICPQDQLFVFLQTVWFS